MANDLDNPYSNNVDESAQAGSDLMERLRNLLPSFDSSFTGGVDEGGRPQLDAGIKSGMSYMGLPVPGEPTKQGTPYETLSAIASLMGNTLPGKGTVYAGTPVAAKYLDFMRSVWPSLMKKADSLREIEVRHVEGAREGATGQYFPKEYFEKRDKLGQNSNSIDLIEFAGDRDVKSTLATIIHELLHPIYRAKKALGNNPPMANLEWSPDVKRRVSEWLSNSLSSDRRLQYMSQNEFNHAALDAQAQNILRSRINKPNVNAPTNFFKQGSKSKNMEYDFPQ